MIVGIVVGIVGIVGIVGVVGVVEIGLFIGNVVDEVSCVGGKVGDSAWKARRDTLLNSSLRA